MRKLGIVVTAIACLMMAAVSFAADKPKAGGMTFGVDGGIAMPTGDFGTVFKMGFTGGVFGDYAINEQFALGVAADYVSPSLKDDFKVEGVDIKTTIIPVVLQAKWMPPMKDSKVAPYIMAGGGFYMMQVKAAAEVLGHKVSVSANENKPGFFGGAGVDFKASPQVKVGVFGKYHDILTEGTSTAFITAGVSVGFGLSK
jgi:opacity protein-like surface antigen